MIIMKDDATKVAISKRDLATSTELPGATLQIIDKDGNVIEERVSGDKPHEITAKLIAGGTYTLKEITTPDGYNTAESVQFTVKDDGSVTEVVMYDEKAAVQLPPVRTGDTSHTALGWILIAAGAALIGMLAFTKKKEGKHE